MEVEQQDELAEYLINSLKRKELKKATKAVEKGADPNYIGPEGFAAIHLAAGLDGCVGQQLLNLMLRYGGNPNLKSSDSETALHVAVMWNRESSTRMLLAHGADPTIQNSDGLTAFDLAENTSDHEQKCLDLLRTSWNDNSSESDFSPNERTVLFQPALKHKHGSKNHELRESLMSPKRKSTEFTDAVDGGSSPGVPETNGIQAPYSPSFYKRIPPPNHYQLPYNPMWIAPSNEPIDRPQFMNEPKENLTNGYHSPPRFQYSDVNTAKGTGKDSFFDLSVRQNRQSLANSTNTFKNQDSYISDTQDSLDTAFTWDSDIDSSTSYFSLPKHSLKGLIKELKDGEEKYMLHKGVNGEASVIIGSDFESRISLGEIPFSLIKNTNESIISEQLKRNSGRKSAEKLFLRRTKLLDMQSGKRSRTSQGSWTGPMDHSISSPNGLMPERPRYFRTPFPLISAPDQSYEQKLDVFSHDEDANIREALIVKTPEQRKKVDKTTQKYFDSPLVNGRPAMEEQTENASNPNAKKADAVKRTDSVDKRPALTRQISVMPSSLSSVHPGTLGNSTDINTRTPTTDETLSQPGNEETEIEFPIMHSFGSPRNLYSDNNETPVSVPMTRSLFDQTIGKNDILPDGERFKFVFGDQNAPSNNENHGKAVKNFAAVQRKIDVLSQNVSDVFPTETESAAGESDGNSSGYSGDMSQLSSPDDVVTAPPPKFDLRNSPSVTVRNKRRKDVMDERAAKNYDKQSSTESNDIAEADKPDTVKADLPASPRKRLNGVTSSSDETNVVQAEKGERCNVHKMASLIKSPGYRARQRVDHTFEDHSELKSPLLPEELKSYHKAHLDKPTRARRKWEHKYDCQCELCMTRKGHTIVPATLPHCEHEQCNECKENAFDDVSVEYDWKDVSLIESTNTENSVVIPEEVQALNMDELKQRLVKAGETPGPITSNTKNIYLKHLARVEAGVAKKGTVEKYQEASRFYDQSSSFMEYVPEMRQELKQITSNDFSSLEEEIIKNFDNPQKHKWREGIQKTSFNYILLDPRVTAKLKDKSQDLSDAEKFGIFVRSIFYIGKGKESRPYEHLNDAVKLKKANEQAAKASEKLKMILNIWQSGYGVVSLHLFHSVIPVEAYTREACMIEAMGLTRLTNLKKGDYYGSSASWKMKKKRQLGIHLLKKALQIFLVEGEKQIKENDL